MTNFEKAAEAQSMGDTIKFMRCMLLHMQEQDLRMLRIENRQQGLGSFADDLDEEDNFGGPVMGSEQTIADQMLQGMNKAAAIVIRDETDLH